MDKIQSFTDLTSWQQGHLLVLDVYKITKKFPTDERFGLVDQMRRCAFSITSNIAEGFSRKSKKEKIQFYYLSKGSITELQNQLLISRDIGYIDKEVFTSISTKTVSVHKLINSIIKSASDYANRY